MVWGLAPHAVFAGVDGGAGFPVCLTASLRLTLVPILLAFSDCQLALYTAVAEEKAGGNERVTLDLRLGL